MQYRKTVVVGAGGFIGGWLVRHLIYLGYSDIRAVDIKPLREWHQLDPFVENLCLDCSTPEDCNRACEHASVVFNLAADMGGMGFIEKFRIECLRSSLINTHLIEAACRAGVEKYFFASSACVYNATLQSTADVQPLKESDAYPAMAERGYGWEKLFAEMFCEEYWAERDLKTYIARFHNVYGPHGTWKGGREKAPAALCRKVIEAIDQRKCHISIWGDGTQTRSFMFIDDCIEGILRIVNCDQLIARPINLGSSELVPINVLADKITKIAGVTLAYEHELNAPQGVAGRNSDNTLIKSILDWEPSFPLDSGLANTYRWIEDQYHAQT